MVHIDGSTSIKLINRHNQGSLDLEQISYIQTFPDSTWFLYCPYNIFKEPCKFIIVIRVASEIHLKTRFKNSSPSSTFSPPQDPPAMNGAAGIIDSTPEILYPDWVPPPSEAAYYSIPSPSSTQSALAHLFAPLSSAPRDQTYGRQDLPLSPAEEKIREEFEWRVGRCGFVDAVVGKGKGRKGEVAYTVWLPKVDNRKDLGGHYALVCSVL